MANTTDLVITKLDEATKDLPVDQLISELQLVVERISFSQLESKKSRGTPVTIAEINLLLDGEISAEVLGFVQWMSAQNMLSMISDSNGLLFLDYCIKKYKKIIQIKFTTAISLDDTTKETIKARLLPTYPVGTRMIFNTSPSIVAGFILDDGQVSADKSLRSYMQQAIKPQLKKLLNPAGAKQ